MTTDATERFDIALNTPAGQVTTAVEVPTQLIPVTSIVPLMRHLGEEAQALETSRSVESGKAVSCQKGCAACCRMLVPLSVPEAFALREWVSSMPMEHQSRFAERLAHTKSVLLSHGLWRQLSELCEASEPPSDDALEAINQAYYRLRIPCPFLEEELCTIYEERPAACRELLVTTPAEQCEDLVKNQVEAILVPVRVSTVLGLLWQELTKTPAQLIPLPLALEWAERHQADNQQRWKGTELLDQVLDKAWRFLSQSMHSGQKRAS